MRINKIKATRRRFDNVGQNIAEKYVLGMNTLKAQAQLSKVSF